MIRIYVVAVDSLNPLRPTFAHLPSEKMFAGLEVIEEAQIPSPDELARMVSDCVDIARSGSGKAKPQPPPKLISEDRPGELAIVDRRLEADASAWDSAPSYDERFANVPDSFD